MRPGYSESSTPWKEAFVTVPSILSTGASKRRLSTWRVDSFGLADLVDDLFVMGAQFGVAVGLLVDDGADPVVLTGVGSDVGEDAELLLQDEGRRRSCCRQWSVPKWGLFFPLSHISQIYNGCLKGHPYETRRLVYEGLNPRPAHRDSALRPS